MGREGTVLRSSSNEKPPEQQQHQQIEKPELQQQPQQDTKENKKKRELPAIPLGSKQENEIASVKHLPNSSSSSKSKSNVLALQELFKTSQQKTASEDSLSVATETSSPTTKLQHPQFIKAKSVILGSEGLDNDNKAQLRSSYSEDETNITSDSINSPFYNEFTTKRYATIKNGSKILALLEQSKETPQTQALQQTPQSKQVNNVYDEVNQKRQLSEANNDFSTDLLSLLEKL